MVTKWSCNRLFWKVMLAFFSTNIKQTNRVYSKVQIDRSFERFLDFRTSKMIDILKNFQLRYHLQRSWRPWEHLALNQMDACWGSTRGGPWYAGRFLERPRKFRDVKPLLSFDSALQVSGRSSQTFPAAHSPFAFATPFAKTAAASGGATRS